MPEARTYPYEVMFLVSQATASDLAGLIDHIGSLFQRARADVLALRKWDERRLAYEVQGQKRGVYFLAYIKAPNTAMAGFERDCNLSEKIMRTMILRCDHLSDEQMRSADARDQLATEARLRAEAPRPAAPAAVVATPAPAEAPSA